MSRGDQMARQWKILQYLLTHRRGATVLELVSLVGCHRRTVYRDLDALQDAGFPLHNAQEEGRRYWKIVDTYAAHLPIPFNLAELTALYFSRDLLNAMQGSLFTDALEALFEKIKSTLPREMTDYLDRMAGQVKIGTLPGKRLKDVSAIMEEINQGVGERRRVRMNYKALNQKSAVNRKVDPYAIWVFDGTFYLIAYCHQRQDVRIFALDRIRDMELTSESFDLPQDFDVDEYMQDSLGVFHGSPRKVEIWFAPSLASYIKETLWHKSQRIVEGKDGSLVLGLQVAINPELESWILRWGGQARVLHPLDLVRAIKNQSRAILMNYENKTGRDPSDSHFSFPFSCKDKG